MSTMHSAITISTIERTWASDNASSTGSKPGSTSDGGGPTLTARTMRRTTTTTTTMRMDAMSGAVVASWTSCGRWLATAYNPITARRTRARTATRRTRCGRSCPAWRPARREPCLCAANDDGTTLEGKGMHHEGRTRACVSRSISGLYEEEKQREGVVCVCVCVFATERNRIYRPAGLTATMSLPRCPRSTL